ncbi:transporter substrate-binding domain-containing protein [Hydrogenophaga sp. PBL-H3]|uniref:transporter substrate-binding domain-containing protein n=1 Tax=Hydrogenophaga sp. PBL-H3 TaxID=434010 RepID=UPI00131FCB0D|nr:transporter substrate-binding domain-containing protein [Hydrogenophaga sp. PBL-H3]QHE75622.1 transporter substrate-binding domain-containing protein [Hydrogenophaga sp. PBL-H3]QHE80048.1 transporter substrate-binding domain-containing protein [Hydrogenophaga sp. PBL-H3]
MPRSTHAKSDQRGDGSWLGGRAGRWLCALVLAWVAACPVAGAQTTLRYGGDAAFAPFESLNASGQPEGFQIELMQAVGRELGVEVSISLQAWPATVEAFKAGRVDVIAMVETTERRAYAQFLEGHAAPAFAVYLPVGKPAPRALQDLQGSRIAVLDHEPMRESLRKWLSGIDAIYVRTPDALSALKAVQLGFADMALLPRAYADPVVASGAVPGLVAGLTNLSLQTYSLAVVRDNDELRQHLQGALDRLETNGTLPALRERWLSDKPANAERQAMERDLAQQLQWTWWIAVGGSLLLLAAVYLLRQRGRAVATERARRQAAEQSLRRSEELLDHTFQRNPEPMLVIDHASGVVQDANPAVAALLGLPEHEVVGQPLRALAHHIGMDNLKRMARAIDLDGLLDAMPVAVTRADGQQRACLISADKLRVGELTIVLCIVRDVTERLAQDPVFRQGYQALNDELAQDRRDAPESVPPSDTGEDRLREFTRAVAHDLRAPLLAIQGFMGLMRERLKLGHTEEALEYSEQVDKATRRMNAMIEALCNLAQIDQHALRRSTIDMSALAQDTWTLVCSGDMARSIEIRFDPLPPAQGDADLVAQVWQNLLHNAWKYTARVPLARVRVDSFQEGRRTWYRVADNGAGFDMAHARALFQPFRRMHSASQFEGSGIGLSMVQRIVRHHGGKVRVRSQSGVGTVAEFTLDPSA